METRNYWLNLFSGTTWEEFWKAGGTVSGFRDGRWKTLQKVKIGDYFICYLTGVSRFVGLLEVTSEPFRDRTPIWQDGEFPCRIKVREIVRLEPETAIPVLEFGEQLTFLRNLTSPFAWTGHFRGSPNLFLKEDGETIVNALYNAKEHPVVRPVDPQKLAKKPHALRTRIGSVTVPGPEENQPKPTTSIDGNNEVSAHVDIQYRLLKLGCDMGFSVWVARNDKNREINGRKFSEHFNLKESLPLQFDEATTRTIELIDVLWLRGNAIIAAFEVESTTSIYSGLLRMSDLIAMQPNLSIPLYLVAPEERREKVFVEVNRPTFSRLNPPLAAICRYISFSRLQEHLDKAAPYIRYLRPEFLIDLSEACLIEDL